MDRTKVDIMPDNDAMTAERNKRWAEMYAQLEAMGIGRTQLWDGDIPGFDEALGQSRPTLAIYPIHRGRGMFIICAGGGFRFKSIQEAKPVADYFYKTGLNVAILDYRVRPYDPYTSGASADGKRAVRWLRFRAQDLGIPADKIAIGGFSAGALLSGNVATHFDAGDPHAADPVERTSSRPDAALLLYGAGNPDGRGGGRPYDVAKANEGARRSNALSLRFDSPPFFLFQTHQDDPHEAVIFALACADKGIPFEIHTFHSGPHGAGLYDGGDPDSPSFPHTAHWAELAGEWLADLGF